MTPPPPSTDPLLPAPSALRGVGEVVAYVPYQLGFTPQRSIVLVLLEDTRLLAVVRFDPFRDATDAAALTSFVGRSRARTMTDAVVIGYGACDEVERCVALAARALERAGRTVGHRLQVEGDRWRALRCDCGGCPTSPTPVPDIAAAPVAIEAILRGAQPGLTRADLEALAEPTRDERSRADRLATVPAGALRPAWTAIARLVAGGTSVRDVSDDNLMAATRSVGTTATRDALLAWVAPDAFDASLLAGGVRPLVRAAERIGLPGAPVAPVGRLLRWANSVPPAQSAPLWTIVAAHEWARGGGALASIALDKAFAAEPRYPLAHLVAACLEHGVTPGGGRSQASRHPEVVETERSP